VWFNGIDQEGKPKPPEWVCSRLYVTARTRELDGNEWGYLLVFYDPLGNPKQWAMPARFLAGDGGEYRTVLLSMGLRVGTTARARNLLTQYIQTRQPVEFASCTAKIGWHRGAFVLPHKTLGEGVERVVYQTEGGVNNTFSEKGLVADWIARVGALCAGNSRLVFAVSCAFAGPLLRPASVESGGFHLRGDSSSGKTTALKVAASVYGGPSYLQRWRATDNALEAIAAQHNDCLLILDELAQIDPKLAGECAYMLANEQGKGRATRTGTPRPNHTWRLLFLSAGELGLAAHMAEGMKRIKTGQEVRMVDIPADAGAGLGGLEALHGRPDGASFVDHMQGAAGRAYGAVGLAWLDHLCEQVTGLTGRLTAAIEAFSRQLVPSGASGQVARVGRRFALVAVAGEMASAAGLTGWAKGESEAAVMACFRDWLQARGGDGNGEVTAILRAVKKFLEVHGAGRFTWWHRAADDHAATTMQRAGYRRMLNEKGEAIKTNSQHMAEFGDKMTPVQGDEISVEYFVLPETFRAEVCQGYDHVTVSKILLERGILMPDKGRTYDTKQRLPGMGLTWCYRISPKVFEIDI
jgi:putative DNA primase/helicase